MDGGLLLTYAYELSVQYMHQIFEPKRGVSP